MQELKFRRALCAKFIEVLRNTDDPRRFDAITHYEAQLNELDRKINGEQSGDIVIGLKPGIIHGSTGA